MTQSFSSHSEIHAYDGDITPAMMRLLLTADPNETAVRSYLTGSQVLLCRVEDKLAGIAVIVEQRGIADQQGIDKGEDASRAHNHSCELMNIAVDTAFQGRGLAKALIEKGVSLAKNSGASFIDVGTGNSSLAQLALYQKCGFRMQRIMQDFFADYPEPIIENGMHCIDKVILRRML